MPLSSENKIGTTEKKDSQNKTVVISVKDKY